MDIHGENSFRAKSYSSAAFTIEKLPVQIVDTPREKLSSIKGIGEGTAAKIMELLDTGKIQALEQLLAKTPAGILEMMQIKGLGPKKIATIWKEMEIESIGELLYACNENRLTLYKGFGAKTQANVQQAIEFFLHNKGHFLYAEVEELINTLSTQLQQALPGKKIELTGAARRQSITLESIEWITTADADQIRNLLTPALEIVSEEPGKIVLRNENQLTSIFYLVDEADFYSRHFILSGSAEFIDAFPALQAQSYASEEEIFEKAGIPFIPPFLREQQAVIDRAKKGLPRLISNDDIRGIIHSHSRWSDGSNTLEEMVKELISRGKEYLVISDHSRSAFYANGLSEDRIRAQHAEIDELNARYAPFRIFKSIESDILNDGSLDYPDKVLASFDLVIASVHSNLKMPEEKAMARLLKAIQNPYTRILGHMTGRLLLSRNGYPVDHRTIIDACAQHNVVIELNAHPRRLDIDWSWIPYAMEKGVLLSVNPDAHSVEGFDDTRYGVLAGRKGLLTPEFNLSSFTREQMVNFVSTPRAALQKM